MRTAKTLIRLGGYPGWSESSLGAQPHCWFCHVAAHMEVLAFPDADVKRVAQWSAHWPLSSFYLFFLSFFLSWYTLKHLRNTYMYIKWRYNGTHVVTCFRVRGVITILIFNDFGILRLRFEPTTLIWIFRRSERLTHSKRYGHIQE